MRWLSGTPLSVAVLRVLLAVLPLGALALALPEVPDLLVVAATAVSCTVWVRSPEHVAGVVALVLVAGWWAVHDVVDWRLPVVAVLLLAAHVVATLLSYGPPQLALDPRLARLWAGRALLALVPMPVAWVAVRGLDPDLAPSWVWLSAGTAILVLLVATTRVTQSEPQ